MKSLIIIDYQKDFCKKTGALYVNGAENSEKAIIDYIENNASEIIEVIFTVDWHTPYHCSFMRNNGQWPIHCIQYSEGAGISDDILKACFDNELPIKVFKKGNVNSIEEYGAFNYINTVVKHDGNLGIEVNNIGMNSPLMFETSNFVVCGLAGDYCVKESIKNLLKYNGIVKMNIEILKDGISSIDDGTTFDNFVKENYLKCI